MATGFPFDVVVVDACGLALILGKNGRWLALLAAHGPESARMMASVCFGLKCSCVRSRRRLLGLSAKRRGEVPRLLITGLESMLALMSLPFSFCVELAPVCFWLWVVGGRL